LKHTLSITGRPGITAADIVENASVPLGIVAGVCNAGRQWTEDFGLITEEITAKALRICDS
jgi:hypothetical protein